VALVADVEDREPLAGPDLHLVVDLGDQRAHGVDHEAPAGPGRLDHLGRGAVGAEHERGPRGNLRHVVDEHHAQLAEPVHHQPVVDDLVVAVHRRLEDPDHPPEGLDRHLDAGAEAARRGQQHLVDVHQTSLRHPPPVLAALTGL
jgi:hypothetical protein